MHVNLAVLGTQPISIFRDISKRCSVPIANNDSIIEVVEGNVMDIMVYVSILTNEIPTNEYKVYIRKGNKSFLMNRIDINDFKVHKISKENNLGNYRICLLYSGLHYNIPFDRNIGLGEYVVDLYEVIDGKRNLLISTPVYVEYSKKG